MPAIFLRTLTAAGVLVVLSCSDDAPTITPPGSMPVAGRALADRPDDSAGPQIHVMYVVPDDGLDRQLDVNGTLGRSVSSFHAWFTQHSNGLAFRFDTFEGALDITFHRLSRSNGEMLAYGAHVVTQIEQELSATGRIGQDKIYIVYYDGSSTYACGGAAWPPLVPGRVAAMYLHGTPGGVQCAAQPFVTSPSEFPRYWEFAMLHDLIHTLGVVAVNAPNHTQAYPAHVPESHDLMFSGPQSWVLSSTTTIDVGGNDYFGSSVPAGVVQLTDSPFVTTAAAAALRHLDPVTEGATQALRKATASLPVHPPFPKER